MDINLELKQELHKIHRTRNRIGYLPSVGAILVSNYVQHEKLALDPIWIITLVLIIGGSLMRLVLGEFYFDRWARGEKWAIGFNFLSFFFIGCGWGLHFYDISSHYGSSSPNVSYTLLIIAGFITGSSTSLLGDKLSYYTYTTTMTLGTVLTYFVNPAATHLYVLFNILLYYFFSISTYRLGHQQIISMLRAQITSNLEKEKLKKFINAVPGFVTMIDRDRTYVDANQATLENFPDLLGQRLGSESFLSEFYQYVDDFFETKKDKDVFEIHETRLDMWLLVCIQRTRNDGAIIVSIPMDELVRARSKVRDQEAKGHYSAKLASLGEMAAGIAHEVNNPLTIIQGSASIIQKLVDEEPMNVVAIKELTEKMISTTNRISKTIKSLKALSRNADSDPFETLCLRDMLGQCVDICQPRFRQYNITLTVEPIQEKIRVFGREVQLCQVLVNLFNNSLDAVQNLEERWVRVGLRESPDWVELLVSDSGKGIAPEILDKIMDPFFTTKGVNQGTGLGLSISRAIMRDHGGDLFYLPEEKFTTFCMKLKRTAPG
ncbi:MAG TPA: ATP-binding protein [Bacteriovoracaceae bacterium]|nr:ATP-binding protein [Bacteriovoracaceae bacterium]